MATDAIGILILMGVTITIGYIGYIIFEKTKVPDIIWLLLFGFLVGPIFGLVNRELFIVSSPFLTALAILIILFDGGLHMNFYETIKDFSRSVALSGWNMSLSMIFVGIFSYFFIPKLGLLDGIILGAMLGGTSSPIVLSIVNKLTELRPNIRTFLELESIITDPLCIVLVISFLQISLVSSSFTSIVHDIVSAYSIGAVIGFLAGLTWLSILDVIREKKFDYILTIGVLLLLYAFVESIKGSGAIAALVFGLVLGNSIIITKILRFRKKIVLGSLLKKFHEEITFFIRSFFFVYLGLIVSVNLNYLLYGLAISAILIILRIIVVRISTVGLNITKAERHIMDIMIPRGLAAAILIQLPLAYGSPNGDLYLNIGFITILATVIYSTIGTKMFYRPKQIERKIKVKAVK